VYTLIKGRAEKMKNIKENEVKKILGSFENALYWLAVMVTLGDLTESEAGYFISKYNL
jgi:hypothetical protein